MPPLVSVVTVALNQGDWVRDTIPRIRESLDGWEHEIIVVDDQSVDGCCHGLDKDVLILRTDTRHGVTGSRRLAMQNASGELILFTDPHCHYPGRALHDLCYIAAEEDAIILPPTTSKPVTRRARYGGFLSLSDRGLKVSHAKQGPGAWPALIGTIYAMKRTVYDSLGGWPELPGVWGYGEQSFTLMAWFSGVPIQVATKYICNHEHYHPAGGTRFAYRVPSKDQANNGHWVHAGFFPETYEERWLPILKKRFRDRPEYWSCLHRRGWESRDPEVGRRTIKQFRREIRSRAKRSEEEFYEYVLGIPMREKVKRRGRRRRQKEKPPEIVSEPRTAPPADEQWLAWQRSRSKPTADEVVAKRQDRAIKWFIKGIPGCLKGRKILDLGARVGYVVEQLDKMGAGYVEGVEVVPETAEFGKKELRRNVVHGDMRYMPYKDGQWHIVTCIHTLEHVPDPEVAIKEMLRVLMPGGWFLIVVPLEEEPRERYAHYYAFKEGSDLVEMVEKFPVEKIKHQVMGLSPKPAQEVLLLGRKKRPVPKNKKSSPEAAKEVARRKPRSEERWLVDQKRRSRVKGPVEEKRQDDTIKWFMERFRGRMRKQRILDVGSRDGHVVAKLSDMGATVEGIEVSEEAVAKAQDLSRNVIAGDMRKLPYKANQWHIVFCLHTLEHVSDPEQAMTEMLRVLVPGGMLMLAVPIEAEPVEKDGHYSAFADASSLDRFLQDFEVDVMDSTSIANPRGGGEMLVLLRKKESA